jgi:hypothetical protein
MTFVFVAGSGKSVLWFVDFEIPPPTVPDVDLQFYNHTRY